MHFGIPSNKSTKKPSKAHTHICCWYIGHVESGVFPDLARLELYHAEFEWSGLANFEALTLKRAAGGLS